ncbi:MAG: cysteine--tRNA ligase [Chloroflexi bacterium]|nr:cysteine--tRNA ligase [Chloroflexota bacterium]
MALRIWNTLAGEKQLFESRGDPVGMYVCGMTPKFRPHLGHARLYVVADVIRRTLEYLGYGVKHVQNFTDIDDKIIERARSEGIRPDEASRKYTDAYFEAMARLGVRPAHEYPTVTGSMPSIIAYIQGLIDRGYGYVVDGDVYFEVARFPEYGKLSGRTDEEGLVGARKELEPGKRDPRDFALWKRARPGEPSWPSPWGEGRPGWHIECSTMVRDTLGDQVDLHLGGRDLLFPHHENEIAQSEAFTGCVPFARYWVHIGVLQTERAKMSHSLLNFTTVDEVLDRFEPAVLRLYLLGTHYRAPMVFSEDGLRGADRGLRALRAAYAQEGDVVAQLEGRAADALREFTAYLEDDFNTAGALGILFDTAHELNRAVTGEEAAPRLRGVFRTMIDLLGLPMGEERPAAAVAAAPFVELLVETRTALRDERQWVLADRVRDRLRDLGVVLEDTPNGTVWRLDEGAR